MCSYDLIIKMDSDDIMYPERITKQIKFMNENPHVMICGSQVSCFKESKNNVISTTNHQSITWDEYKQKKSHWISNHPSLCYRKSAALEAGNYDFNKLRIIEDFDFTLRMLKTHKYLHNLEESLLYYRLHNEQVTHNGGTEGRIYWNNIRENLIENLIQNA
jgi:hypothetical protein